MKIIDPSSVATQAPSAPQTVVPPGEYNNTWFDPHIRYWETLKEWAWEQRADRGGLRWLEIGCFEGRSAAWLLYNLVEPADHNVMIVDPWGPGPEWQPIYERAMRNLAPLKCNQGPYIIRTTSASFWSGAGVAASDGFDFIYIDGSHKAPDVELDLTSAWKHLRLGGVILADDFYNPHTPGEERTEVEAGLRAAHEKLGWTWPPARFGIDVIYQRTQP